MDRGPRAYESPALPLSYAAMPEYCSYQTLECQAKFILALQPWHGYTNLAMKYIVLIMDGAAGWPLPNRDNRTCLELAHKPNLDNLARHGVLGLARTVPDGMEPSSACACLSIIGYDPNKYLSGRGAIEARSLGISLKDSEVAFRCNLVAIRDGKMFSYSSGQIEDKDSHPIIATFLFLTALIVES